MGHPVAVGASEGMPDGRVDVEGHPEGPRLGAALD